MSQPDRFTDTALGLISTQSFPAIVGTADMMLKSSGVVLVGYEKTGGGYCTAVVRGGISDVRLAIEVGIETAEQFGQKVSTLVVPRPMANLEHVLPIGSKLAQLTAGSGRSRFSNQAVGLLETRGFPAMVGSADAMLKAADVTLSAYETIGSGLCTAIVRGNLANVAMAIEAGMQAAEHIGELHSVMVIPRALDDLDQTLPLAKCWIEELQPLRLPIAIKETEKALVALPELKPEQKELLALPELQQEQKELLALPELQQEQKELLALPELQPEPLDRLPLLETEQSPFSAPAQTRPEPLAIPDPPSRTPKQRKKKESLD
jgi:carbon dioxide concentrating mechanism protein CcmO